MNLISRRLTIGVLLGCIWSIGASVTYAHELNFLHRHDLVDHGVHRVVETHPTDSKPTWKMPATLFVSRCIDNSPPIDLPDGPPGGFPGGPPGGASLPGMCGHKPVSNKEEIGWDRGASDLVVVMPTTEIRFGPFTLKRVGTGSAAESSDEYEIQVLARSSALYGKGSAGQASFVGANAGFSEIGRQTVTLTGTEQRTVFVDAELPGVFSAIKIVTRVGSKELEFPAGCSALPPTSTHPDRLDEFCLQAGVNPLAILEMKWVPLTILYEPPGNCSWSNLERSTGSGVSMTTLLGASTSSRTISDSGFAWDAEHLDIEQVEGRGSMRSTTVRLTRADSVGTRFGLPHNSPGNPACNQVGADIPTRLDQGPGRGDVFVMLRNADFLYWDTGTVAATALSPVATPGNEQSMIMLTADQIRNDIMPPGVPLLTVEEKEAILGLSPFQIDEEGEVSMNLSEDRFLPLGTVIELGPNVSFEHLASQQTITEGGQSLTHATKSIEQSSDSDPVVEYTMSAIQFGSSAAATAGAKAAMIAVNPGLAPIAHGIKINLPKLFTDKSKTTTRTQFSRANLISRVADNEVVQQFFLRDTEGGLSVSLYWDSLFGTYVFLPHVAGAGFAVDPIIRGLPVVVWRAGQPTGGLELPPMPASVRGELQQLGVAELEPTAEGAFRAAQGRRKARMPNVLRLSDTSIDAVSLPADAAESGRGLQSLYIGRNAGGHPVAQVWLSGP